MSIFNIYVGEWSLVGSFGYFFDDVANCFRKFITDCRLLGIRR